MKNKIELVNLLEEVSVFSELNIKRCYRTKKDDIKNDLLIPLISNAVEYDRGTGFFSIDALIELSAGIIPYINNGGIIKIVTSVDLDVRNLKIIKKGIDYGRNMVSEYILDEIDKSLAQDDELLDLDLITNLIAVDKLQIKIAYLPDGGIYHEKICFIKDADGQSIWFTGSNNETYNGLKKNAESFLVLKSWQGDMEDIEEQKKYFESLWNNNEEGIDVFDIPEAAKQRLFSKYKRSADICEAIKKFEISFDNSKKTLYPYQEKAVEEFVINRYCHFFEMATGTGKTFTAVKAVERMSEKMNGKSLYVIVVVPQIDLQMQWKQAFEEISITPHLFGGNSINKDWENELSNSIINYHNGDNSVVVSICIYDTFFSKINKELENKRMNKLIIVDEAHELSRNQINSLSENYKFRLGLSATPERHSLSETNRILNYFTRGEVQPYEYSIDEAIKSGFLSKYEYYPIIVYLNDFEFSRFKRYTLRLAQLLNAKIRDDDKIQEVLNNRSIIIKKAKSKTEKIKEMAGDINYNFVNSVIYCGQGKDAETEESIIDSVTLALKEQGKYRVSQFTSKTDNRDSVLREFENVYYDTLVAIKCFDQGVDVPKLDKIYIMASDSLTRQTIQRRGRVLRRCKETGKNMAYIYDFVCLPPEGVFLETGASSLVAKELKRVREYGRLAENISEVNDFIEQLVEDYNVTEDSDDERETNNK